MSKYKSCFISAPTGTNLKLFREALNKKEIQWIDQSNFSLGDSLQESTIDHIKSADFFCLIIPKLYDDSFYFRIFYELGIAEAAKKPILIFVSPNFKIPTFIRNYTYIRSDLDNLDSINYNIDTFTKYSKPKKTTYGYKGKKSVERDFSWIENSLKEVEMGNHQNLENFVFNLFEKSGLIVSESNEKSFDIDLAIWIDSVDEILGNPIPIELKYGYLSEKRLNFSENALREYMDDFYGKIGLIIYFDKNNKKFQSKYDKWPFIIRLSISELVDLIINDKFEQELIKQRNLAVHGGF